jgi:hypothetical protein
MSNALDSLDISPFLIVGTVVIGATVAVNLRFQTAVSATPFLAAVGLLSLGLGLGLLAGFRGN